MKQLIAIFLLLVCVSAFGAVPDYKAFRGSGGITIVSNPPQGTIVIDGSGVVATGTNSSIRTSVNGTNLTAGATNLNLIAGTNIVLSGTNMGSDSHIGIALTPNVSIPGTLTVRGVGEFIDGVDFDNAVAFHSSINITNGATNGFVFTTDGAGSGTWRPPTGTITNIGVGQTTYIDPMGNDATGSRTNFLRAFRSPTNAFRTMLSGDRYHSRGSTYSIPPITNGDPNLQFGRPAIGLTNLNNISITGDRGAIWQMAGLANYTPQTTGQCNLLMLSHCANVLIDGMTFIGVRTNIVTDYHYAIRLDCVTNLVIKNCTFLRWQDHAIVGWDTTNNVENVEIYNCLFEDIGGIHNISAEGVDGTAIAINGYNINLHHNTFRRNFRDAETWANGDVRRFRFQNNYSEYCYNISLEIVSTNFSDSVISDNVAIGYATNAYNGVVNWLNIKQGSNVVVRGNVVRGYYNIINHAAAYPYALDELRFTDNVLEDIGGFSILGQDVPILQTSQIRNSVFARNTFKTSLYPAFEMGGNNNTIENNDFLDINYANSAQMRGVIELGYPSLTNKFTNNVIRGNRFVASSANAETGIVIRAMAHGTLVYDNENVNYAAVVFDSGTNTAAAPMNFLAPGMLYTDGTRTRKVTIGGGVTFDTNTGTLTGTGGSGTPASPLNSIQFNSAGAFGGSGNLLYINNDLYLSGGNIHLSNYMATLYMDSYGDTAQTNSHIIYNRYRGNAASPSAVQAGDTIAHLKMNGYADTVLGEAVSIQGYANGTFTDSSVPGLFTIKLGRVNSFLTKETAFSVTAYWITNDVPVVFNSNVTFYSSGHNMNFGWWNRDAGGTITGTGTNFGWYDLLTDTPVIWTSGSDGAIRLEGQMYIPNMSGSGNFIGMGSNGQLVRTNAPSGTPGGSTEDIQFNQGGAFAGTNEFRYRRSSATLIITNRSSDVGLEISPNTIYGFGDADLYFGIGGGQRWRMLGGTADLVPSTNAVQDIGSATYAVRTNFMVGFFMAPNAQKNKQLRSVNSGGVGMWGNPAAGGNGNTSGANEAARGAIQFAETNTTDHFMMLDSTNAFMYKSDANELWITNNSTTSNTVIGAGYITTKVMNVSNLNVATLVVTNGLPAPGSTGQLLFNGTNIITASSLYTVDEFGAMTIPNIVSPLIVAQGQIQYVMPTIFVGDANSNQTVWLGTTNTVSIFLTNAVTFTNFSTVLSTRSATYLAQIRVAASSNVNVNWGLGIGYGGFVRTNANNPAWSTLTNGGYYLASWTAFGTNRVFRLSLEQ